MRHLHCVATGFQSRGHSFAATRLAAQRGRAGWLNEQVGAPVLQGHCPHLCCPYLCLSASFYAAQVPTAARLSVQYTTGSGSAGVVRSLTAGSDE